MSLIFECTENQMSRYGRITDERGRYDSAARSGHFLEAVCVKPYKS